MTQQTTTKTENKSARKQKLEKAQDIFDYCANHPNTIAFRSAAALAFDYYDGKQFTKEEEELMRRRNQKPLVYNRIASAIKAILGVEISTRKKIVFKSQGLDEQSSRLAEALSHVAVSIQESNHYTMRETQRMRHGLIAGVGWGGFQRNRINNQIQYHVVHPLDILFDPDDTSDFLDNMNYVCRIGYMPINQAIHVWPHAKAELLELAANSGKSPRTIADDIDLSTKQFVVGTGVGQSIKYIEVQTKEEQVCYEGFSENDGHAFKTFNKELAQKLNRKNHKLRISSAKRVFKTVFTGDILLEYDTVEPAVPDMRDFTYVPFVYGKSTKPNIPVGLVHSLIDVQDHWNAVYNKVSHDMNSFRVLVDEAAVMGTSLARLHEQLKNNDRLVVKPANSKIEFLNNLDTASFAKQMLAPLNQEFQSRVGFYDEAMGKETNATSGIAIQARQANSVNNQRFAFDSLAYSRKREGFNLLSLIQTGGQQFLESSILNSAKKEPLYLNIVREIKGKLHIWNDVRTLPVDIFIEQIEDYGSLTEADNDKLVSVLSNPNLLPLLMSPEICKRLGFYNAEKVSQEVTSILQQQRQQQQPEPPSKEPNSPEVLSQPTTDSPNEQNEEDMSE